MVKNTARTIRAQDLRGDGCAHDKRAERAARAIPGNSRYSEGAPSAGRILQHAAARRGMAVSLAGSRNGQGLPEEEFEMQRSRLCSRRGGDHYPRVDGKSSCGKYFLVRVPRAI